MPKEKTKIVLDDKDIKKTLNIKDVIKVVEDGFYKKGKGLVSLPPKTGPRLPIKGAFADSMSAAICNEKGKLEALGIKWIAAFPENLKNGLPVLNSLITLNNPETGIPVGIFSGNWITGIRTGAVSVVCAKYLAPKKKNLTVGIFGLGLQAYIHVLAFKSYFKNVNFILYNHGNEFVIDFKKRFSKEKFQVSKNFHEIVKNSDIILSATSFPPKISPYIFAKDLKKDVLILPVDYGTRVDPKLYKHLDEIYTDDISQYELKSKLRQYFPSTRPRIKKEMGEIICKRYKRGNRPKRILVFNLGIALFDVLTARLYAKKIGLRV